MLAVLTSLLAVTGPALDLSVLATQTTPSVVHLAVLNDRGEEIGNGSGFFVSRDGRIVTNHHVIEDAGRLVAQLSDGRKIAIAGMLADDKENDVAVIQADGDGFPPLPLSDGAGLAVGDDVVVIGSPMGLSGTLSSGVVSAIREGGAKLPGNDEEVGKSWKIQTTAPISPGSSGSPVMTRDGRVVGVAVGIIRGAGSLGFAVPISAVNQLLVGIAPGTKPKPIGPNVRRNLLISAIGFSVLAIIWVLVARASRRDEEPRPPARPRASA